MTDVKVFGDPQSPLTVATLREAAQDLRDRLGLPDADVGVEICHLGAKAILRERNIPPELGTLPCTSAKWPRPGWTMSLGFETHIFDTGRPMRMDGSHAGWVFIVTDEYPPASPERYNLLSYAVEGTKAGAPQESP